MRRPTPRIRSHRELDDVWQLVDGGHGYDAAQLFAVHVDRRGHVVPNVIQVYDDDADGLGETVMAELLQIHATILATEVPGGSLALMRARPGDSDLTDDDVAWCRMAHRLLAEAPFRSWPLYFATDRTVGIVPPDVLV
jgi:hypothetical protein